jgi:hypothetical protein
MTARINVTRIEPRVTINCRADGARIDRIGIPGPPGSGGGGSGALTTLTYSPSGTYTLPTTPADRIYHYYSLMEPSRSMGGTTA